MRNIKLILEYDGSDFFGFQRQPKHRTVQEALETALSTFFKKKMKITAASGRTDTGVHAEYQVVNFKTTDGRRLDQMQRALNALLPKTVAVKKIAEAPDDFHARYSAKAKTYEYCIWNSPVRSPLLAKRSLHIASKLNIKKMKQAAAFLTGTKDFSSFCASRGREDKALHRKNTRTIYRLQIKRSGSLLRFQIEADGFLYHMVRNMLGALIEVGRGKLDPEAIQEILAAKDRRMAPATVPANGLTLKAVVYGPFGKRSKVV